jgi:hypothetical protein
VPFSELVSHQLLVGTPVTVFPAAASPAVAATRRNDTLLDALTITAMLDAPGVLAFAGCAMNAMSSKWAPTARLSTSSAYPVAVGATVAKVPEYDQGPVPLSGDPASAAPPSPTVGHSSPP